MVRRRQPGDPWYTAIYPEPHTLWWAPAVLLFVLVFAVARLVVDDSLVEALAWAAVLSATYAVFGYVGWRRTRE